MFPLSTNFTTRSRVKTQQNRFVAKAVILSLLIALLRFVAETIKAVLQ